MKKLLLSGAVVAFAVTSALAQTTVSSELAGPADCELSVKETLPRIARQGHAERSMDAQSGGIGGPSTTARSC